MITLRKFFSATLNTGFEKKKKYFNQSLLLRYIFLFVSFSLSDSDNMTEFQRLVYWKDSMLPKSTGLDSMVQL